MINFSSVAAKRYVNLLLASCFLLAGCSNQPNANKIVNKAISKAGGKKFDHSRISFTFRGSRYHAERDNGTYTFSRSFTDSSGAHITDRMSKNSFIRTKDGKQVDLAKGDKKAYANALNSVIYFGLLPYKLNDPAVQKKYVGKANIKNKPYYQIKVTFNKEGGGKDYRDSFLYWINPKTYTMDYMAYHFHVNGGGTRFRAAKNVRIIKGMRFADYNNYKGLTAGDSLQHYVRLFNNDKVQKVSEINIKDIKVKLLKK